MNKVYMLIATAGRASLLSRTLHSISECDRPSNFVGVIVVENGPPCGSKEICEQSYRDLSVQYLWSPRPNKSDALNYAMQTIPDSSLVIFSDDDIRFSAKTLTAYVTAAEQHPRMTFFGGPFACDYELAPPPWLLPFLPLSAVGWHPDKSCFQPESDRFLGFNWAAYCRDIKRLGGFDPNYGPGSPTGATGQETNMQRRMHASGMRSHLVDDAFVYHFVPQSRCSIEWTVQRARRNGASRGFLTRSRSVTDIAYSHWTNLIRIATSSIIRSVTSPFPNSRVNFHAKYRQQKALGYFAGFRAASNGIQESLESVPATDGNRPLTLPFNHAMAQEHKKDAA